ncbi:MAG: protein-glutamate O-methyltransferase [Thermodesulfobacteriota bacterium]
MAFDLTESEFARLAALVYAKSGLNLHQGKMHLMRARLGKRLRATGCRSFSEYFELLTVQDDGKELTEMVNAMTTNKTGFFREASHFRFLQENLFPKLGPDSRGRLRLRFWSAGCSTGEEPYSLAISALDYFRGSEHIDAKILGTDVSTHVLLEAQRGIYSAAKLRDMPITLQRRYFQKGFGSLEGQFRVKDPVRRIVMFRRHNLMESFPQGITPDAVFCRNVMIYFDKRTQQELIQRFYDILPPGGHLFLGHSESLAGHTHSFTYVQPSIYRK